MALRQDSHHESIYELTGPEALTPADQARILADVLDKPVAYTPLDPDVARSQLEQYGMPSGLADAVIRQRPDLSLAFARR